MAPCDSRRRLELFNEKFEDLLDSKFYQRFRDEGRGLEMSFDPEQPMDPVFTGPRESDCKDIVNNLRLFSHKGEPLYLPGLEAVYTALGLPEDLLSRLREALARRDVYRKGKTPYTLGSDHITRDKLYHVFVYGSIAHLNPSKRQIYEDWERHPMFPMLESYFIEMLILEVPFLYDIYVLNHEALKFGE